MCGIIGYVGPRECRDLLMEGLRRLEYRGYDSAGLSVIRNGSVGSVHAVGNLERLRDAVASTNGDLRGSTGIGHTRWATHGRVTEANAHPLRDTSGRVHIALNGIVENWAGLRQRLIEDGADYTSETDAEVVAHLVAEHLAETRDLAEAVRLAYNELRGHYAFVAMSADHPGVVVGARKECPLVVGLGEGESFIAPAIPAFLAETRRVQLVQDDEIVEITPDGARFIEPSACGTSYHAGLVGRYAIEWWARRPVEMDIASEFRYRNPVLSERDLVIGISQSGETADTLAAMRLARERGAKVLAVTNLMGSQATRDSDGVIFTRAGLEIGVAATKTFVAQVAVMQLFALKLAGLHGTLEPEVMRSLVSDLRRLPHLISELVDEIDEPVREIARHWKDAGFFLYLGRHVGLSICLEGALKLKEISYIPTDAYAAGEMKHGPIALLDERTPVVCVATDSPVLDKVLSNIAEVRARGAHVIAVATEGTGQVSEYAEQVVEVPRTDWLLQPRLAERVFTDAEREYAAGRARPGMHLAARFCAKEAVAKALGLTGWSFRDVEVVATGAAPRVRLSGSVAARAAELGGDVAISLTHTDDLAGAVA